MAWDHSGNPRQSYRSAGTACGRRAPAETLARVEVSANDPQTDTTNVAGGVTRSPLGKESWTNPPGRGPGLMPGGPRAAGRVSECSPGRFTSGRAISWADPIPACR